jgi:ankyrin repeat protein
MQTLAAINTHLNNTDLTRLTTSYICPLDASPEDAARWGHYELVATTEDDDLTPRIFRQACRGGCAEIVKALVERGESHWDIGYRAACRGGHRDIMALMLEHGAVRTDGFADACCGGHLAVIDYTMCASREACLPCIHTNCKLGTLAVAHHMIGAGIHSGTGSSLMQLLMCAACRAGHIDTIEYLITRGLKGFHESGLFAACMGGHVPVIDMMITLGAHDWDLALHGAINGTCPEIVRRMVEKAIPGKRALTRALHTACEDGHLEIMKYLLTLDVDATTSLVMWKACRGGNLDVVNLLIARGNTFWNSGMRGACETGHLKLIIHMIERGATNWDVCLQGAVAGGNLRVIQHLIKMGATGVEDALYAARMNGVPRRVMRYLEGLVAPQPG